MGGGGAFLSSVEKRTTSGEDGTKIHTVAGQSWCFYPRDRKIDEGVIEIARSVSWGKLILTLGFTLGALVFVAAWKIQVQSMTRLRFFLQGWPESSVEPCTVQKTASGPQWKPKVSPHRRSPRAELFEPRPAPRKSFISRWMRPKILCSKRNASNCFLLRIYQSLPTKKKYPLLFPFSIFSTLLDYYPRYPWLPVHSSTNRNHSWHKKTS